MLSSSTNPRSKPTLEIIPDTRFIVFHGGEHEAAPVKLTGVVRLTTPESMSISKPKVMLEGKRKISWFYYGGYAAGQVTDKRAFWTQDQKLGIESTHKIKAGTIEWPFEFDLSPSMPESVEGLFDNYIAYHLHASVSRPGWNAKDLVCQEHIRIVRTLGPESMEITRSRVNADVWANKVSYSISIPTDAIVFGTSITADVELSPLKKGLTVGQIEMRLSETVVKRIQLSELPDARADRTKSEETEVAKHDIEFPENCQLSYNDETADNPMMADEMYKFKATLPLPKSLNTCRQDVDSHQLNITHRFKLMINLHNPEGHVSQLVCRLPVKLFISPNLPVDESNRVSAAPAGMTDEALNNTQMSVTAPPEYGLHQLDQLFSDMDPTGYMSRAPSNPASPSGAEAQSRRDSHDDGPSINGVANGATDGEPSENNLGASPSILRSRLADLQERDLNNNFRSQSVSFSNSPSGSNSPAPGPSDDQEQSSSQYSPRQRTSISQEASEEEPQSGVRQRMFDLDNLSRVPSYGAALRAPRDITPCTETPPSYVEATSRPPSPGSSVQRPDQAHTRTRADSFGSQDSEQTLTAPSSARQSSNGADRPRSHHNSIAVEDQARVRKLRVRT